ncbi:MAG: DUF2207 family protein [Faecousia sp.]
MRRLIILFLCCVMMSSVLVMTVSAENTASKVESYVTVTADGDCLVSTTIRLYLDSPVDRLVFPVPLKATDITLNGGSPRTEKTATAIEVDVSRVVGGMTGEIPLAINYNIPGAVGAMDPDTVTEDQYKKYLQLTLPLLSGFSLPVQNLSFVVTMPDNIKYKPNFSSTYQQTGIEAYLKYEIDKNMLTGQSTQTLNDRESVTMTMGVERSQFPTVSIYRREGNPELKPMLICAGLALLYWFVFLRTWPLIRRRSVTPPEGVTAGEIGCHLTLAGGDLTMMVFHWAQMGYILIHREGGRVMLHKRMDMGNERSPFEVKVFKMLFANRRAVDATGYAYTRLSQKVFAMVPGERNLCKSNSGNTRIFRLLACGSQLFCGICVAMNMTAVFFLQVLLSIVLGIFGVISAWQIHEVAYRTHLRGKTRVFIGLTFMAIWVVLGILCGQWIIPTCCALGQWMAGFLAAYGGRRSDVGRYDAGQILGLRHYLKHISKEDIHRIMKTDPEYFFNMAPYALALGIIYPFAKNFGSIKMDQCPYLVTRVHGKRTAEEWAELISDSADLMDSKFRRMEVEKWFNPQARM